MIPFGTRRSEAQVGPELGRRSQISGKVWANYWRCLSLAGLPINLSYSADSDGEQIISRTSKLGGCSFMGNLSRATQGFVYIFGSSIITVHSKRSWSTRRKRSS